MIVAFSKFPFMYRESHKNVQFLLYKVLKIDHKGTIFLAKKNHKIRHNIFKEYDFRKKKQFQFYYFIYQKIFLIMIMKMMMTTLLTYSILLVQDRDSILQNEITKKTKDLAVYQLLLISNSVHRVSNISTTKNNII